MDCACSLNWETRTTQFGGETFVKPSTWKTENEMEG